MADVRRLRADDRSAWLALLVLLSPDETASILEGEISAILADPYQAAFGAFEAGIMTGLLEVGRREWGEGCVTSPVAWIESILVLSQVRRRGVGRQLVEAAADWARRKGFQEMGSDAELHNLASIASHRAWGFEETLRLVTFRLPL